MAARRLCLEQTYTPLVHPVYPRHANRYGTLHGGELAGWVLEAGGMAAMRASGGYVVLGAIDHLFILSPARVGENLVLHAWAIGSTRHTLDVLVYAEAHPRPGGGGGPRPVSVSLQTFVAVDASVRPRPHGVEVAACSVEAEPFQSLHERWLADRRPLLEARGAVARDTGPLDAACRVESYKFVHPVDEFTLPGVLDASRLFRYIDEAAAVSAIRHTASPMVTASFDAAVFAAPAYTGDIVRIEAGITGAGTSSLEIAVKTVAENPVTGRKATVAKLYTVFVNIGPDGRPRPLPRRPTLAPGRLRDYQERRRLRQERRKWAHEIAEAAAQLARLHS